MCVCNPGWKGESCNQSVCPSTCSGHGSCLSTGEGCLCDTRYTGKICDIVECLGGGNCTAHGICREGVICIYQKGYFGSGCEAIDVAAKCSNHGINLVSQFSVKRFLLSIQVRSGYISTDSILCAGYPNAEGNCICDLWFTGPDCSIAV